VFRARPGREVIGTLDGMIVDGGLKGGGQSHA